MAPLTKRRILVTRSRQQASELAAQLQSLGATTLLIPTIEIVPPESFAALDQALQHLDRFDWVVFTSANAAAVFAQRSHGQTPKKIAAIGPSTAKKLKESGFYADLIPPTAVAESLASALIPELPPSAQILLVRAAVARDHLPFALTAAGARVTIAEAYRTVVPQRSISELQQILQDPALHPDAITFTSSSTATNLMALLEAANLTLPPGIVRASIGPITSATLHELGIPPTLEAPEANVPSLVRAIEQHFTIRP